jgi:hypothetical protein
MSIEINGFTIILETITPFEDPVPYLYYEKIIEYECFYRSYPTMKRCPMPMKVEYEIIKR